MRVPIKSLNGDSRVSAIPIRIRPKPLIHGGRIELAASLSCRRERKDFRGNSCHSESGSARNRGYADHRSSQSVVFGTGQLFRRAGWIDRRRALRHSPLTVTTYDSAYIHLDRWGNRFGLLIFDECHHLPGPTYTLAATGSIAPYRLGLTATPERADGQEAAYPELIGPIVYRREIKELSGDFLAEYKTERIYVSLSEQEQDRYVKARELYRKFILDNNISMSGPNGWQRFIFEASRSKEGWEAYQAYREQKRLERAAESKLQKLQELLEKHRLDRTLIFTADNATVYQIARQFLVPAITHQTKTRERKQILERFHSGEYPIVVTSQVLNEGVDVPSANVGIVLSGTGTIRENVQRLGRLLRKQAEKQAILYEIVARGTTEEFTSERRRQHHAFR